jgi:phosphoribosylaminoimidazolecarboxamide formyltransferase/IMP cyclohydrolase
LRALISVYEKTGIVDFASKLSNVGIEICSTGGTYDLLAKENIPVRQVSEVTGFPEILDGRVKTLHPVIHGGVLARRDINSHMESLNEHNITAIDIVVVNLYPFEATIRKENAGNEEILENIDIGGPTLLRAAAKNYPFVLVITDPSDYSWVAEKIISGVFSAEERRNLAAKAFSHVSTYDSVVSGWLRNSNNLFPEEFSLGYRKISDLRYGENPHQAGAVYSNVPSHKGIVNANQLHGKELSFNNILDANAAWAAVSDFSEPTVAVIKHTNPCGLSSNNDLLQAYISAYEGDPVSAFGGIVAFNRPVNEFVANELKAIFYEIVIAPDYTPKAVEVLQKKRDLRILKIADNETFAGSKLEVRSVSGGVLIQTFDDNKETDENDWQIVSERTPTDVELLDLKFAWKVAKHVKSNAIVLINNNSLIGMGAGQPNRVNSVHLALKAAGKKAHGAVLASDAFFPFPDGVELAISGGVKAIIQPGGSIRDAEVIEAVNKLGVAMVFTGTRHFKH